MSFSPTPQTPIYLPGESPVHHTALEELALALDTPVESLTVLRQERPRPGGILVARLEESAAARELIPLGLTNLHNVAAEVDAYEVLVHEGVLYLLGRTPRGLLQAVYALQERLAAGESFPEGLCVRGTFRIPLRIFHPRFDRWPGERADVRYISHLGASHCLVDHDWQGSRRHLQGYVTSPIFPRAVDPAEVAANHAGLRRLLDDCAAYGLEAHLWLTELPCQGGPWVPEPVRQEWLTRFPAEVLGDCGTYQGKVLCFSHPMVQAFYRDLLQRFFAGFPEISAIFLFGIDSGGEFCDPALCPRCRGLTKFEQRDRLLRFLLEEGQKVRPGLRVLTTGWHWEHYPEEFLDRQAALPAASGLYFAAEDDGWQPERQAHDFLRRAREVCRQRGQWFIGYDNFHWGDDTVHGLNDMQDFPLGIGAKLERWAMLGVDGVFDHWGGQNEDISCNSIACREFFLDPYADPKVVARRIARRQFGPQAGELAYCAWAALERAHAALSNACTWPPHQWPGWYQGREQAPTPEHFEKIRDALLGRGLLPKVAGPFTYNAGDLAQRAQAVSDAWAAAYPHYQRAIAWMTQAVEAADEGRLFYAFWWSGKEPTPTRREHLRRQRVYLESMALIGREIGLHFGLLALYERLGRNPARYRQEAGDLLQADAEACRAAAELCERLQQEGDDLRPGRGWAEAYRRKAEGIVAYLG